MTTHTAQWLPASDSDYQLLKGKMIFTREGDQLGIISEIVHPDHSIAPGEKGHFFVFDPGPLKDWFGEVDEAYLPEATIYAVTDDGVYINLTEEEIRDRQWTHPTDREGYISE